LKKIQLRHRQLQDFLDSCDEKLKKNPENAELLNMRALLLNLSLNYQKGIDELNKILERSQENADMYILRADCLMNMNELNLAKHDYLRALKLKNPVTLAGMVESYIITETIRGDEEIQEMTQVILYEKNDIILRLLPGLMED